MGHMIIFTYHFQKGTVGIYENIQTIASSVDTLVKRSYPIQLILRSLKLTFSFDFQCLCTILLPFRASFTQEHTCEDELTSVDKIPFMHNAGLSVNSVSSLLIHVMIS